MLQTSANLTPMAMNGQWNHLVGVTNGDIYADYIQVFDQAIRNYWPDLANDGLNTHTADDNAYRAVQVTPNTMNIQFPIKQPGNGPAVDPFVQAFRGVYDANGDPHCTGTFGRTKIRVMNYAMYEQRGQNMANELRRLKNAGCDVAVIFAIASKPVRSTLLNRSPRIPVKQSAIKDSRRELPEVQPQQVALHLRLVARGLRLAVRCGSPELLRRGSPRWPGSARATGRTCPSTSDEQIQRIEGRNSLPAVFNKTWNQGSSSPAGYGRPIPGAAFYGEPDEPTPGKGVYKLLEDD